MDLSVVIPTHNHCEFLRETLRRLGRQVMPARVAWEVIVVNNGCTDATPATVDAAAVSFPVPLRLVSEPKLGVSSARNKGIQESLGRVIAFVDDDTFPEHHWLQAVWQCFEKEHCDAVIGRIELHWRTKTPAWVNEDVFGFMGYLDYGASSRWIDNTDEPPNGGNMAFRRSVLIDLGGFNASLGRIGRSLFGGEEPELFTRFLKKKFTAIYQPDAVVYHVVDAWRVRKSYFRKVHFNEGKVRGGQYNGSTSHWTAGIPLFILPQLLRSIGSFAATVRRHGYDRSLRMEMNVWYFLGFIIGSLQLHKSQRSGLT
jgi:glucosyl-dolichyl phosphate glucuronosyltransferase